jgi:hypothetical protein
MIKEGKDGKTHSGGVSRFITQAECFCGGNFMYDEEMNLGATPPTFRHVCTKCHAVAWLLAEYPDVEL